MSRPQKIHPPLKFSFSEIINSVADGKGVKSASKNGPRNSAPKPPARKKS